MKIIKLILFLHMEELANENRAKEKTKEFALGLKLQQPSLYLKSFPVNEVWRSFQSHVGQPVVANGLSHADSYCSVTIAL